jgi:type IV secretion system protein VirB10
VAIPGQASPTHRATTADVLPLLTSMIRQQRGEATSSTGQGAERVASAGGPPGGVYRAQPTANTTDTAITDVNMPSARTDSPSARTGVGSLLTPTMTPKVTAAMIGDRNMLLTKGTHIDCALTVKIINEVSGFASCVLPSNVYSHNGKVLLLERASEVQGEYTAQLRQGQRRLFVLWDRVVTPHGVVISFASPAADSLGTMGIDGYVDNRWWDRLGAAFLLSFVKDVIGYQIAKDSQGANSQPGGLAYQNSVRTGESMADRILSQTINVPPTIYKNQGDLASIYVARDLDFSTVYTLKAN